MVTKRPPTDAEMADLRFAWVVCKHVKSNAIVLAKGGMVVGVGAGQMSRVDSVHMAVRKAGDRVKGAVLASDAFFPFRDNVDEAAKAGVTAMVQPGGSMRDAGFDRGLRRARPGDGVHRRPPFPALIPGFVPRSDAPDTPERRCSRDGEQVDSFPLPEPSAESQGKDERHVGRKRVCRHLLGRHRNAVRPLRPPEATEKLIRAVEELAAQGGLGGAAARPGTA